MTAQAADGPGQFHSIPPEQTFGWWNGVEDAMDNFGLTHENVLSIVHGPESIRWAERPPGHDEWPTEKRQRGDVQVVITWPPGERPIIWAVYVLSKLDPGRSHATGSVGGATGASQNPTSVREIKRRLVARGFTIEPGGKGDRVMWQGDFFWLLHTTPGEYRSVPNVWSAIKRKAMTRGVEL